MSNSILVTGASGFVGTHLVRELQRRGERVVTHSTRDGDLSRTEPTAEGIRHVYHLAARTYVPESWLNPRDFYEANVLGTVNVLEFCRKNGISLTLLSSYVYGRPGRLPISEDHPLQAFNPYSHSKILAEQAAQFYQSAFRVPVTIVRAFNLYGPSQANHFLIPALITQALSPECEAITVDDLRPKRDYIFIDDLISLLVILLDQLDAGGIYNAGSGVSVSVQELAELVVRLAATGKCVQSRERHRQDEVFDTVADISRARDLLNWSPRVGIEEGLRRTMDSYRAAMNSAEDTSRVVQ
jgi:nucleoside-diphosphate-sugar epimerase